MVLVSVFTIDDKTAISTASEQKSYNWIKRSLNVDTIIQKAYTIMKTANWPEAEKLKYEMEINEEDVKQQQLE